MERAILILILAKYSKRFNESQESINSSMIMHLFIERVGVLGEGFPVATAQQSWLDKEPQL